MSITANSVVQEFDVIDKRLHVVGFGKAVYSMAVQVEEMLQHRLMSGIVSTTCGAGASATTKLREDTVIRVHEGAKDNLPDLGAFTAAREILEKCLSMTIEDVLIVVISGGGSALLPYPRSSLTLQEKTDLIRALANNGATINELNTVRIALSEVKGGRLANAAKDTSQVITLIVSDIVNDPLHLIASGPTVTHVDTLNPVEVLRKCDLLTPALETLIASAVPVAQLKNVFNFVILNNRIAISSAVDKAKSLGYEAIFLSRAVIGNITEVAKTYFELARHLQAANLDISTLTSTGVLSDAIQDPKFQKQARKALKQVKIGEKHGLCIISGGETTVNVTEGGKGGRNQELALRLALSCIEHNLEGVALVSAGTDGIDGPTEATGAIGYKFQELAASIIDEFLQQSNSFKFFKQMVPSCHIVTGHTETNVMDVHILLIKV